MINRPFRFMWASSQSHVFDDANYIYEPAWDGLRVLLHKEGRCLRLIGPSGRDIAGQFPELSAAVPGIDSHGVVLDGCIVAQGHPAMPRELVHSRARLATEGRIQQAAACLPVRFVAFDVLQAAGQSLTNRTLASRKATLDTIVNPNAFLRTGMYVRGSGNTLFAESERRGAVGIVAKKADSMYQQGKISTNWLQVNHSRSMNVIILGYRVSPKFSVMVGLSNTCQQSRTAYQPLGWVEDGFTDAERSAFLSVASDFVRKVDGNTSWVKPELCCTIRFHPGRGRRPIMDAIFAGFDFELKPYDCDGHVLLGDSLRSAPQGHANERKDHNESQRPILQPVHHGV